MIIVAGIARSGLTATMQMLNAGKYPCAGEYPAFEPYPIGCIPWNLCEDKAIKLVDAQLHFPPLSKEYKIIYLLRDMEQQAKSMNKFLSIFGMPKTPIRKIIKSFKVDYKNIDNWAKNHDTIMIKFENMILHPLETAKTISEFTGNNLDVYKMSAAIIKRGPECGPELLELSMLGEQP